MFSFIRSHRSALVCLAGLACLALLLLLAVVGLFLAAFPAAAQNSTTAGPNSAPTYQSLVQSHDILYKMSRDILYTPGALNAPG